MESHPGEVVGGTVSVVVNCKVVEASVTVVEVIIWVLTVSAVVVASATAVMVLTVSAVVVVVGAAVVHVVELGPAPDPSAKRIS